MAYSPQWSVLFEESDEEFFPVRRRFARVPPALAPFTRASPGKYLVPPGNDVWFNFAGTAYTAPAGNKTNFNFDTARQALTVGFLSPNFVVETAPRSAILPGTYVVEETIPPPTPAPLPPPPALQKPWHHMARFEEEEPEWRPPRLGFVVQPPGKHKKHHVVVLMDEERARYEEDEILVVYAQRKFAPRALAVPHIKPYHHVARIEEPDPDWAPLVRGAAQGPQPTPPRQRPWHHFLWLEDLEPDPVPARPQAAIAPLAAPPRYRPWWHSILHEETELAEAFPVRLFTPAPALPPAASAAAAALHRFLEEPDEAQAFPVRPSAPPVVAVQITPWWRIAWREEADEAETFPVRPSAPPVVVVQITPWWRIAWREEADEAETFPVRLFTPAPALPPVASAAAAALHRFLEEPDEAQAFPVRPSAPPVVAVQITPWWRIAWREEADEAETWLPHPAGSFVGVTPPPPAARIHDTLFIANLGRFMNR